MNSFLYTAEVIYTAWFAEQKKKIEHNFVFPHAWH